VCKTRPMFQSEHIVDLQNRLNVPAGTHLRLETSNRFYVPAGTFLRKLRGRSVEGKPTRVADVFRLEHIVGFCVEYSDWNICLSVPTGTY